jgi:hypothetical protein
VLRLPGTMRLGRWAFGTHQRDEGTYNDCSAAFIGESPHCEMMEQTKHEKYRLKSEGGRPANLQDGQETRLYDVMEELMKALKGPATMDQIVKQAEYRTDQYLLKTETSVERSIRHHFRKWLAEKWIEQS